MWEVDEKQERACGGIYKCNDGTYCGSPYDYGIPVDGEDLVNREMIRYNIINFDNIFKGLLSVFMTIDLAGWTKQMYLYMDCSGYFAAAFYVFLVVSGAFFSLNMFLAVMLNVFTEMDKRIKRLQLQELRKERILNGVVGGIFAKFMPKAQTELQKQKQRL